MAYANADLVLNHTVDKPTAAATDEIVYTLRVTNNGPQVSEDIVLVDNLPATTSFVGYTADQGSCSHSGEATGGTLTCNIGTLANFAEAIVTLTAVITDSTPSTIVNTGSVSATTFDPDLDNNTVLRNVTVTSGTDLEMVLSGSANPVVSGGILTYTASVNNLGPDAAINLSSTIQLAPGFNRTSSLPSGCSQVGQTVTCTTASLNNGATWNIGAITGVVSASGPSQISTSASVGSDTFDGNATNNTSVVDTNVDEGTDVSVTITRTGGALVQLDEFVINLNPRYSGGQPQNLTMTTSIDPAFEILTAGPFVQNGWSCTIAGQDINCTRPDGGGAGGEYNYNIGQVSIDVRAIAFGNNLPNTVSISAASPVDSNLANNDDTLLINVQEPNFDLQALKSGPTRTLRVVDGEAFQFSLSVRNNSNVAFVGELTMTDTLPGGLRVDSYGLNGWNCSPATPVNGPDTITCTRTYTAGAPLAAGATTAAVTLNTTATAVGVHTNQMCVTNTPAPGYVYPADSNNANDCASSAVEGQLNADSADIRVNKSGDLSVVAGEVLTYQLEIVNAGPNAAQSVTLTDTFSNLFTGGPGNGFEGASINAGIATFDSCTNSGPANVGSRNLSCTFTTIPVCTAGSDCPVITVQVRPLGNTTSGIDLTRGNTASAYSSLTSDPVYGNNTDDHDTEITPRADISAVKTANWAENPNPIAAGTELTYTITVRNETTGASGASNVSITDTLPLDVTFVSASASGAGVCTTTPGAGVTTTLGNREVICDWPSIQRNGERTVTIVVRPNHGTQGATLLNQVNSTTVTPEVTLDNNADDVSVDVAVAQVDLATTQTDAPDPIQIGDAVIYTLTVTNYGPSVAEDVRLYNVLPTSGLSFQGFQYVDGGGVTQPGLPPGISCPIAPAVGDFGKTVDRVDVTAPYWTNGAWDPDLNNADIICDVADLLLVNESVTFQMVLQAESSGVFPNHVISRSREHREGIADINPPNDTEPENTTVRTSADMELVSKTATPGTVSLFEPFEYTVVVRNNGPHEALGVELADTFPAGMELTGSPSVAVNLGTFETTTCGGVAGDTDFTCDFGEVSPGAQATVTIPVRLTSAAASPVVNTATINITGLTFDADPTNNSGDGPVDVLISSLTGRVYHDVNLNGVHDGGEPGIAGVTLTLTGTDDFGNPVNRTTTTDVNGIYLFDNLAPGTYTVTETQPAGWIDGQETIGSEGGNNPVTDVISNIVLAAGVDAVSYDFGEYTPASVASISGFVYHDENEDGIFNIGEDPIAGVVINLSGPVNRTTTTDANGFYIFTGLPPGQYTIDEVQPAAWNDGIDTPGTVAGLVSQANDQFVVTLNAGDNAENWNFGEIEPNGEGGLLFPYVRTGDGTYTFVTIIHDPYDGDYPTGAPPHAPRHHHLFYGHKPFGAAATDPCIHLDFPVTVTQGALLQFEVGHQFDLPSDFGDPENYGAALAMMNNRLPMNHHGFLIVEDPPNMAIHPNERRRGEAAIIDTATGLSHAYSATHTDEIDPVTNLPEYGELGSSEYVTSWYPRDLVTTTWYALPLSHRVEMTPNDGGGIRASVQAITNVNNPGAFARAEHYTSGVVQSNLRCFAFLGVNDFLGAAFASGGWMSLAMTAQNANYSNPPVISDGTVASGNIPFELWKFQHIHALEKPLMTINRAQPRH